MQKCKSILFVVLGICLLAFVAVAAYKNKTGKVGRKTELPAAKEEMTKLWERYIQDSAIETQGKIAIYDLEDEGKLKETNTFDLKRDRKKFYYRLAYQQTMCDGKFILQLDTVNKYILVSLASNSDSVVTNSATPFDALFADTAAFRTTGEVAEKGNQRFLKINSDLNPDIKAYTVAYDPNSYRLLSADIETWKNPTLEVSDSNKVWLSKITYSYKSLRTLDISEMMKRVIRINGKKIEKTDRFKDYELHLNF